MTVPIYTFPIKSLHTRLVEPVCYELIIEVVEKVEILTINIILREYAISRQKLKTKLHSFYRLRLLSV